MKIGILALQGAFIEHRLMFESIGISVSEIRLPGQLKDIGGLVIPGGESTTMMKLMNSYNLVAAIRDMASMHKPVWGTCAGMICLASHALNPDASIMQTLSLMDITVRRNAFGRQVDSFEAPLQISGLENGPFPGVFIRAPFIEKAGRGVKVLCTLAGGEIVAARQDNLLVTSFHPELTADARFHSYFAGMIKGAV
jgi:pyridoxal 5'-phosphate synthase pdxT subunit